MLTHNWTGAERCPNCCGLNPSILNGILLPIILVFILLLTNDKRLTGDLKNTRRNKVLAVGTLVLITSAVLVMLGSQLLELIGVKLS